MAQPERPGQEHGDSQADRQPKAVVKERRSRLEVSPEGPDGPHQDPAGASPLRDRRGQPDGRLERCSCGDQGIDAQRDRQIGDDAEGLVVIVAVEDLLDRAACPELVGHPAIERGAMGPPGLVHAVQVRRGAAFENRGTRPQSLQDHGGKPLAFLGAGPHRRSGRLERAREQVDDLLQLREHLEIGAITPVEPGRPPRRGGVFGTRGLHRLARVS